MGLKICSLSSGSTGNCIYVASDSTKLIIDCGVPTKRVEKSLQVLRENCENVSVLVTHNHSDHTNGIETFAKKYNSPIFSHYQSGIKRRITSADKHLVEFGENDFFIGDLLISPIRVSHDVPTVGFSIHNKDKKISVLTDLGVIDDSTLKAISDSNIVLLESNHDEELVKGNKRYSFVLKKRILSQSGHLSNSDCADAVVSLAKNGVKQVILAHLSQENNYPELAFSTVSNRLKNFGINEGTDIKIEVAPALKMSGLFEVC